MKKAHIFPGFFRLVAGTLFTFFLFLAGCSLITNSGTVSLSLTDAPVIDAEDIEGVFITIDSIAYNLNGEWVNADDFEGPRTFNLLELNHGEVAPLSETKISAGTVSQIRFILNAPPRGTQTESECFVAIDPDGIADGDHTDDVIKPLFVPSGSQTGYKATGPFDVPVNGTVEITADFDIRKSVVYTGNRGNSGGTYLLKPTIRLIVNDQAGSIGGSFAPDTSDLFHSYVIFAYESGTYSPSEETPEDEESPAFTNAISSTSPFDGNYDGEPDRYTLPFLAPGSYDLILAGVNAEGDILVSNISDHTDIAVSSKNNTTVNITLEAGVARSGALCFLHTFFLP